MSCVPQRALQWQGVLQRVRHDSRTWCGVRALLGAGRGQFTAALEVVEAERLVMSFLHHMALQRQCRNPFEKGDIAGITNYLDVGLQVLSGSEHPARITFMLVWVPKTSNHHCVAC